MKSTNKATAPETRAFKIHPQLLFDVIQRQAGTLTKALCEGVMNSIDAGATAIAVTLAEDHATISDDGKGFKDRQEIELFFETFGQPHKEGDAVFGTFRMGRGQLFSFGRNRWRSGGFAMDVDIKGRGLDYDLSEATGPHKGCEIRIDLYRKLTLLSRREIADDLRRAVRYVPVPVTLDGERLNKDPAKEKWDLIDEDAYYKFSTGRLALYNLGVYVNDNRSYSAGIGGIVVAKRQLRLNFARNDVLNDCPVWHRIFKVLRARADINIDTKARTTLNAEERAMLAQRLRSSDMPDHEARTAAVFQDCTGRWLSISRLAEMAYQYHSTITAAPKGPKSEKVMRAKLAVVLNEDLLDEFFRVDDLNQLIEKVIKPLCKYWNYKAVPFETLVPKNGERYDIVPPNEYTPQEEIFMGVCHKLPAPEWAKRRQIVLGDADHADGWTNGQSMIAINRQFLKGKDVASPYTWTHIALLLCHEYCHSGPSSSETHVHGLEFFEAFHDGCDTAVPYWVRTALIEVAPVLDRMKRKANKNALRWLDKIAEADRGAAQIEETLLAAKEKRDGKAKPAAKKPQAKAARSAGGSYADILGAQGYERKDSAPGSQLWVHASGAKCDIDTKNGKWTLTISGKTQTGRLTPSLAKVFS